MLLNKIRNDMKLGKEPDEAELEKIMNDWISKDQMSAALRIAR